VLERLGAWPLRVLWLPLPVTAGAAFAAALHDTDDPYRIVVSIGLWVVWAATLLATLVPLPATLTVVRIVMPASAAGVAWALVASEADPAGVVGLVLALLASVVAVLGVTGDLFVDGASYGAERRFGLRVPVAVLLGPVEVTWVAVVAACTIGPLLLANEQWLAGGLAVLVGIPVAFAGGRAIHGLHRRWLVFVPAGVVVHDLATLQDPVLISARFVERIGLVPPAGGKPLPGEPAPALGPALVIQMREPMLVAVAGRDQAELYPLDRFVVHPARPGAVLTEAESRRLPLG
jgi:hypothetical protein